jgi:xanthine dehydrogenase accessory factor
MRDVIPDINNWLKENKPVALATVVNTWGSAPRKAGAHMAISADGNISGSVSGGCVEGAVVEEALEVLKTGQPRKLHYGVTDEQSWEVGLACGGEIDIFVQPLDPIIYREWVKRIDAEQPAVYATTVAGEQIGETRLLDEWGGARSPYWASEREFVNVILPQPTLVIVGGVQIAMALSAIARIQDFKTVLIDPRSTFGSEARFPQVDTLIQAWPAHALEQLSLNHSSAMATLTHDPKIDDPALILALNSPAFYIGALGSARTHSKRVKRLMEQGLSQKQVEGIHSPIGLDIGAVSPEEIALSIMAEIIAHYRAV